MDRHKRESQLCIETPDGTFVERGIATTRERFTTVLAPYAPARVLLEAATESVSGWRATWRPMATR